MVDTISELTDAEKQQLAYDKRMRRNVTVDLAVDQLYALTLITLNNSVEPSDYSALGTAIKGVTGVQDINLLVDHKTLAALPAGAKITARISIDLDIVTPTEA